MNGDQVTALLDEFAADGLRVWVAGGWAVDAVVGRQTRPHADLDLAIDASQQAELLALLDRLGFVTTVDWLPVRAELTAPDGRKVDIHPVAFRPDGSGVQSGLDGATFAYAADGFAEGVIDGRPVPCLSVGQQLRFREGYPPREVDRHDINLLRGL
ncbi:aminoglycoside nucleotidyltransferase [Micromonospora sp. 4G57]|uniref:Aminoglycoside nucleotidyltransferase n=1 Tax=Micromonospora sicca TaxID=2202420 RepID=A0ABU5JHE3_9ACTN|nr:MULTISPECIES: aminoglycoside nucleotidyltransferase [unclassified Micromonospora]MDZ5442105.1 aminoglycoside nucleotidyltransferase [Micromonospora sp. 4G57]MDZ5492052.1 aminoglycoside nucleotidyltransferase [Micromonospora sp. 4G53]